MSEEERREYIENERRHDEEKRRKFLEEQEVKSKGYSTIKKKIVSAKNTFERKTEPFKKAGQSVKKPFEETRDYIATKRVERGLNAYKKFEDKEAHAAKIEEAAENRIYGRTLTPAERARMSEHKQQELIAKKERWEKTKGRLSKFNEKLQQVSEGSGSFQGVTTPFNWDMGGSNFDIDSIGGAGNVNTEKWFVKPQKINNKNTNVLDNGPSVNLNPDFSDLIGGSNVFSSPAKKQGKHPAFSKGLYDDLLYKPKGKKGKGFF